MLKYSKAVFRISKSNGKRGSIYGASGQLLAVDYPIYSVFVDPNYYYKDLKYKTEHGEYGDYRTKVKNFILELSKVIGKPQKSIESVINQNQNKHFIVLDKNISLNEFNILSKRFVPASFGFIKRYKRYYPDGEYSAHDVGFCFSNGNGADGLERYYNSYLASRPQKNMVAMDAYKYRNVQIPNNGSDLYTSIDRNIQDFVHINLAKTIKEHDADGGIAIVMNPYNGSIVAMDSYPFYNNNKFYKYKYNYIRNRAVTDVFEPGSVFKLVTMSAALDSGLFKGNEIVYCEKGRWRLKNKIIHDVHRFGWLGFRDVFIYSSNIGSAKIALKTGKKIFYRYLIKYGFGHKTYIDTIGESRGIVKDIFQVGDVDLANMAFGQGIGITAIQLIRAYCVIANGGYMIKPHFMEKIKNEQKDTVRFQATKSRILKAATVDKIKAILSDVIKRGTGRKAAVNGYTAAGKTGTAQVPKKGGYKAKEYIASFVGFAPVKQPKVVVLVSVFNPQKGGIYGGQVAGPLFSKIMSFVLHYYAVKETLKK